MLTGVTLTGADDSVAPDDLLELSSEFSFVEWGILVGSSKVRSRFPSLQWREDIARKAGFYPHKFSAHICSGMLDDIINKSQTPFSDLAINNISRIKFERVQLNFHGQPVNTSLFPNIFNVFNKMPSTEVIVQLDGVNNRILNYLLSYGIKSSGLYDCSHGFGIKPESWNVPNPNWKIGYAGGLGPETIGEDLEAIQKVAGCQYYWIDMETKLYDSDNKFCLKKCRTVLEACKDYIVKPYTF